MKFLQTITNTPKNTNNKITNSNKKTIITPTTKNKPNRIPRPINTVKIQKIQYNIIPPPSSNKKTIQTPSKIQNTKKTKNKKNNNIQKIKINPKPPQIFINTTSNDQPQIRQITQIKFTTNIINENININNYDKINIQPLPNKPLIIKISNIKKKNPVPVKITKKTKNNVNLIIKNQTKTKKKINSKIKKILKKPKSKLKKTKSTNNINNINIKNNIKITRIHIHHHHPKQIKLI